MNLRKSAVAFSIINTVSIALGFVFHVLLGRRFGISWELDCLFISLLIFSFFGIFNNLITSLLMPVFNEIKAKDEKQAFEFADVVFKWSALIGIIIWLIILYDSPLIIRLFASGFDERAVNLTTEILKIIFIGYIFNNLTTTVYITLNALYFFSMPVFAGLLNPIFNITAIFILTPKYGVKGIAVSYAASNIIQAFILLSYLFLKTRWRPTLKVYHERLPELFKDSSKAVLSSFILSLKDVISRNIASHLGIGAVALISYADKIISILHQIIISPISNIFYSKVSELIAITRWDEVKNLLSRIIRVNASIAVFVSAGIVVFLKSSLNILFLSSKFTPDDIRTISYLMLIELGFLIAWSIEILFVRIAYGAKKVDIALSVSAAGIALFYMLSRILSNLFGVYGLALSVSITEIPICILYFYLINRYVNIKHRDELFYPIIKNLIFALPFIIGGLLVNANIKNDVYILSLWCPVWVSLYLAVSRYALKEEWNILMNRYA